MRIQDLLKDNRGDLNIEKVILITAAFIAGSILLAIVIEGIRANYGNGTSNKIHDILH